MAEVITVTNNLSLACRMQNLNTETKPVSVSPSSYLFSVHDLHYYIGYKQTEH